MIAGCLYVSYSDGSISYPIWKKCFSLLVFSVNRRSIFEQDRQSGPYAVGAVFHCPSQTDKDFVETLFPLKSIHYQAPTQS